MALRAADVRRAREAGGAHSELLPDAQGPPTSTYHNPDTGQEFHGLPIDPWSLEKYMKFHGLLPGPASAELRAKWAVTKLSLKDPADEHLGEAEEALRSFDESVTKKLDSNLVTLVEKLSKQVADLTARLDGTASIAQQAPAPTVTPIKPKQLSMAL